MANALQLETLKQGAQAWDKFRNWPPKPSIDLSYADLRGADLAALDLSGADLRHAILETANLVGADLRGANLNGAILARANLTNADLTSANLVDANLGHANMMEAILGSADLSFANLSRANLRKAYLSGAHMHGAVLTDTDFAHAVAYQTNFTCTNIAHAKGLESIYHAGPSSIGIDTIYQSRGQIPESFLRGCGVPDSLITQVEALIGAENGIQFYSCFVSYSTKDEEFARRLHSRLQQEHVRVWFAREDIQGGKKLHEQIEEAIRIYDKLLILLSPHSMQSEWVMTELRRARKAERKTGKRKLFPIRLVDFDTLRDWECFDADGGQDLAIEIRQYFIPDFTNWKDHDSFETSFTRLLKDLRSNEKAVE